MRKKIIFVMVALFVLQLVNAELPNDISYMQQNPGVADNYFSSNPGKLQEFLASGKPEYTAEATKYLQRKYGITLSVDGNPNGLGINGDSLKTSKVDDFNLKNLPSGTKVRVLGDGSIEINGVAISGAKSINSDGKTFNIDTGVISGKEISGTEITISPGRVQGKVTSFGGIKFKSAAKIDYWYDTNTLFLDDKTNIAEITSVAAGTNINVVGQARIDKSNFGNIKGKLNVDSGRKFKISIYSGGNFESHYTVEGRSSATGLQFGALDKGKLTLKSGNYVRFGPGKYEMDMNGKGFRVHAQKYETRPTTESSIKAVVNAELGSAASNNLQSDIKKLQLRYGIKPTGQLDDKTWQALTRVYQVEGGRIRVVSAGEKINVELFQVSAVGIMKNNGFKAFSQIKNQNGKFVYYKAPGVQLVDSNIIPVDAIPTKVQKQGPGKVEGGVARGGEKSGIGKGKILVIGNSHGVGLQNWMLRNGISSADNLVILDVKVGRNIGSINNLLTPSYLASLKAQGVTTVVILEGSNDVVSRNPSQTRTLLSSAANKLRQNGMQVYATEIPATAHAGYNSRVRGNVVAYNTQTLVSLKNEGTITGIVPSAQIPWGSSSNAMTQLHAYRKNTFTELWQMILKTRNSGSVASR